MNDSENNCTTLLERIGREQLATMYDERTQSLIANLTTKIFTDDLSQEKFSGICYDSLILGKYQDCGNSKDSPQAKDDLIHLILAFTLHDLSVLIKVLHCTYAVSKKQRLKDKIDVYCLQTGVLYGFV